MTDIAQDTAVGQQQADRPAFVWREGLLAAGTWFAAAAMTWLLPDVIVWGDTDAFALLAAVGGAVFLLLAFVIPHAAGSTRTLSYYGPWFVAIGIWFALWELTTAKLGWLPKPFFSPPQGLLHVYMTDWSRLLLCIAYTGRLWVLGF
ncbi:MAG: ABC transporter permease, partial [Rhizobium sp.]